MGMRTYGLSGSGMDVDQMVKDLMKARRATYDKVWQQKTQIEWKKKDYNTIYTLVEELRNKTLYDFRRQNNLSPKQVSSTNDAIVSATANGDAANVEHSIIVSQLADGVKMTSRAGITAEGKSKGSLKEQFDNVPDALDFTINGKEIHIDIDDTTTLNDVVVKINQSGAGVKASYDATLDRFFLYSDKTGAAAEINFTGTNTAGIDFLSDTLKLGPSTGLELVQNGRDAKITLDGVELTQSSNTFTISGVTYNLKSTSLKNPDDGSLMPVSIAVKADIEKTIDTVKSFVDMYNAFITTINNELNEERNRNFMPLTDAQKGDMKEADITAYTNRAKSGMLRNDSILSSLLSNMRLNFSNPIKGLAGKYTSASSIGIETGKYINENGGISSESKNGGKIYVNEDQLRKALEEDPDAVYNIFGTAGDSKDSKGVAGRLYDQLYETMDQLRTVSGNPNVVDSQSFLAKRLDDYTDRLNTMAAQLDTIQARYYRQFDAMEAAINRMNQQSAWLAQQLGQ